MTRARKASSATSRWRASTTSARAGRATSTPAPSPPSAWWSCWPGRTPSGIAVGVVGSGSNLLIADAGFRGLVMKLNGALATIEQEGDQLVCGGGARLPQAAARAAARA